MSSAYANWRRASTSDTKLAYAAHLAALDREERAAIAYRRSLEREPAAPSRRPVRGRLGRAVDAVVSPDAGWHRETDLATGQGEIARLRAPRIRGAARHHER